MFKLIILKHWLKLFFQRKLETKNAVEKKQKKYLAKFEKTVLSKSPYYKRQIDKGKSIYSFPVIGKKEFMAHFDEINTVGLIKDEAMNLAIEAEQNKTFSSEINNYTIGLSTGTSGNRGLFVASIDERAQWAANIFYKVVKPKLFMKQKVAFCLRSNSKLYESVKSNFFAFKFHDLSQPIEQLIQEINAQKPNVLCAQPSLLMLLLKAIKKGDLDINPHQVISYAEVLDDLDKVKIEKTFKLKITEIYQCTEGFLGHTCTHGTMHLNEDLVRFERRMIDETRFQPILTDFTRKTQPVVRYLLNDILVLKREKCACGSAHTAIERIEGRMDDVLIFKNKNGVSVPVFPDFIRRKIVIAAGKISAYLVEQTGENKLSIYIEGTEVSKGEIMKKIEQELKVFLEEKGVINIQFTYFFNLPKRKQEDKLRRVKRLSF